jgi:hypothetical protein
MIKKSLSLVVSVMIILMAASVSLSMNSEPVFAAETGCCVKDKSGNYCVNDFSSEEECEWDFFGGIPCSQVSGQGSVPGACERITCLEESGTCSAQKKSPSHSSSLEKSLTQ